jgi:hypothetical protein
MLDSLFSITALVGGTVLGFQFVMMLLGLSHHGGDVHAGHDFGADGTDGFDGSVDGDGSLHHDSHWGQSADGGVTDGDVTGGDASHHVSSWFYEVISIRTLAAALAFFGLVGKTALAYDHPPVASMFYATAAGLAAMYGVYWLFKQVYKLQNAGNENVRRAIGLPATVYVPIPASRSGAGKVTFKLQDRTVEYIAVTNDASRLATGEKVVIVGIVNQGTVRVARESESSSAQVPA